MPRTNRITPTGEFIAHPARGLFMGNRGILHDRYGGITHRKWRHANWIICLTDFKGRQRQIMAPGHYTELFFLDEVTALAAGHRPCYECRRRSYRHYWDAVRCGLGADMPIDAKSLDRRLHRERAVPRLFRQRRWMARLADLPDGAVFLLPEGNRPVLRWRGNLFAWDMSGYSHIEALSGRLTDQTVEVLTPQTSVLALREGFVPVVHPSADH